MIPRNLVLKTVFTDWIFFIVVILLALIEIALLKPSPWDIINIKPGGGWINGYTS